MRTLPEFLNEYINKQMEEQTDKHFNTVHKNLNNWLEEGIKEYKKQENCVIVITGGNCPECDIKLVFSYANTFTPDGDDLEVGCYTCPECGYETYC